jgi:hypothetical protein
VQYAEDGHDAVARLAAAVAEEAVVVADKQHCELNEPLAEGAVAAVAAVAEEQEEPAAGTQDATPVDSPPWSTDLCWWCFFVIITCR